jgi:glycosyltransferase involved in cell wall biosynthesis
MRNLFKRAWCVVVAVVAYPLAALVAARVPVLHGAVPFAVGTAASLTIALLIGLVVLPRRLSPLNAGSPSSVVVAVVAWMLAGLGLWAAGRHLLGASGPDDTWILRSTALVHGVLAIAGISAMTLLRVRFVPIWATVACLPLFRIAFPEFLGGGPDGNPGRIAAAAFIVVSAATYWLLRRRLRLDGYSLILYSVGLLQWVVAAQIGWILAVNLIGTLDAVPRLLPVATGLVQFGVSVLLPIAYLAISGELRLERFLYSTPAASLPDAAGAVVEGGARGRRTAWIIAYTGVSNEPRVRRQADALINDGWRVVVCGRDGHSPRPAEWTFIRLPVGHEFAPRIRQLLWLLRGCGAVLAVYGRPAIVSRGAALLSHWSIANWLHVKLYLLRVARQNPDLKPDIVIAHDYYTADTGYAIARKAGAKFSVDCHEYAAEQLPDRAWAKWDRPCILAVQGHYLSRADLVTTVCDGIGELLASDHRLRSPVLVVRSVAMGEPQPFRPTGERIKVLYHGAIWHIRQLHVAIESMRLWRSEFDLVLRGEGDPSYLAELRRLVTRYGLADRVFFEPPVPFDQIIPAANKADIGYFSYENFSRQSEFVLPNKFFEYVTAGLALCVVDFTEMGRLTRRYGFGKLISQHTPPAIAEAINSFSREEIDRCKRASIAAAGELSWAREKVGLLAAYNGLIGAVDGTPRAPAVNAVVEAAA